MTAFGLVYVASAEGLVATQGIELAYLSVNISFALVPGIASLIGVIIWVKYYPLTGDIVEEMKKEVHLMHEERRTKYEEGRREEK
jgi:Na+/melibiose symporter-like transporter